MRAVILMMGNILLIDIEIAMPSGNFQSFSKFVADYMVAEPRLAQYISALTWKLNFLLFNVNFPFQCINSHVTAFGRYFSHCGLRLVSTYQSTLHRISDGPNFIKYNSLEPPIDMHIHNLISYFSL
jgi:hypothetical protein